jgi:type II restriction enzyme
MRLEMDTAAGSGFKSGSQIARRITECWGETNLYCAACESATLHRTHANAQVRDFTCDVCNARYEMKAGRTWNESRIPDAGYEAMMRAIKSDSVPNLFVLQYNPTWCVTNLMLVPSFFFTESAIERRMPLAPTARRAGWIGCNILLRAIPAQGRLRLVENGVPKDPAQIRRAFDALRPIAQLPVQLRGWTLDVWNIVNQLGRDFALQDVYEFESQLQALHPRNQNIRPKIRQQLQVLRDFGFLSFSGGGRYSRMT